MRSVLISLLLVGILSVAALAENLRFSHQISLNPISPLQSVVVYVPEGEGNTKMVRAMLILDGELLAVPLIREKDGKSFRGTFPTPKESFSYQFQVISETDSASMSKTFEVSPYCGKGDYLPHRAADPELRRALIAQQQRQRLMMARDLLKKFIERSGG